MTTVRQERARAATVAEIKATALRLMAEAGSPDVRFSDIARAMDLTPPALYRYFADRTALLTDLIGDAYADLADYLAACRDAAPDGDARARLVAVLTGVRTWGHADPQRFALVFGTPLPGYRAPSDAPSITEAKRSMAALESVLVDAEQHGVLAPPAVTDVAEDLATLLLATRNVPDGPALAPATYQAMLLTWAGTHGFVSLELFGHLAWMPADARDALFEAHLAGLVTALGVR